MILKNGVRLDGCSDTVPIGTLNPYIGTTPPFGYLICEGQLVDKALYPELYAICGDTFGTATSTQFYLPDLRGQTIAGYKSGDTTFGTLGALIGNKVHTHDLSNHTHTSAAHSHALSDNGYAKIILKNNGNIRYREKSVSAWTDNFAVLGSHSTSTSGDSQYYGAVLGGTADSTTPGNTGGPSVNATGNGSSIQPTMVLNWIVKAIMLLPNQSTVSTIETNSDINTYSCNYINSLNTHSAVEQRIGTWTDGKPIYRKVITSSTGSTANTQFNYTDTPANIDTMIDVRGMLTEQSARMPINSYYSSSYYICAYYDPAGYIKGICGASLVSRDCVIILEYTKTTD